jgi:predicted anti-sigma-YlaC factor YlaD
LRCREVRKHLSAFLDDELDSRKRKKIELHISECAECRRETEKLRDIISTIRGTPRPQVPAQLWEGTRRKIQVASEQPSRPAILRIPKWKAVPAAAAAVLAIFIIFLSSQMFFHKPEAGPMPFAVYLQEHALSYSEQVLPPDLLSELAIAQAAAVTEEARSDEPMSELEMLMEVHYGTYPTNGS